MQMPVRMTFECSRRDEANSTTGPETLRLQETDRKDRTSSVALTARIRRSAYEPSTVPLRASDNMLSLSTTKVGHRYFC